MSISPARTAAGPRSFRRMAICPLRRGMPIRGLTFIGGNHPDPFVAQENHRPAVPETNTDAQPGEQLDRALAGTALKPCRKIGDEQFLRLAFPVHAKHADRFIASNCREAGAR